MEKLWTRTIERLREVECWSCGKWYNQNLAKCRYCHEVNEDRPSKEPDPLVPTPPPRGHIYQVGPAGSGEN
jgi:hypothetical protein